MTMLLALLAAILAVLAWWFSRHLHVCPPNKVLLLSGTTSPAPGKAWRVVRGGRGLRLPFLERAFELDLRPISLDLEIVGHAKTGVMMRITAGARLRFPSSGAGLEVAAECLLGKPRREILAIARTVVSGSVLGELGVWVPEQIDEDRPLIARHLEREVAENLARIGLELEALEIRDVDDDDGYLAAIRRQRAARP